MIVLYGDREKKILSIKIDDILEQIPDIENYKWTLIWIEGVNSEIKNLNLPEGIKNMQQLWERVNDSSEGYSIEVNNLIKLLKSFAQLEEITLLGDKDEKKLFKVVKKKTLEPIIKDCKFKRNVEFFIELVDTSYWEITSTNILFNDRLKINLNGVEVDESQWYTD